MPTSAVIPNLDYSCAECGDSLASISQKRHSYRMVLVLLHYDNQRCSVLGYLTLNIPVLDVHPTPKPCSEDCEITSN